MCVQLLGMTKPPSVRRAFLHHVLRTTEEHGEKQLRFAGGDRVLGDPNWPLVRQLTVLDTASLLRRYVSKVNLSTSSLPHLDLSAPLMPCWGEVLPDGGGVMCLHECVRRQDLRHESPEKACAAHTLKAAMLTHSSSGCFLLMGTPWLCRGI